MVDLLLPRWCPGCGQAGVSVCNECAVGFSHWFRAERGAAALPVGLPVWAAGVYTRETARVIMAWKSRQRPDLDGPLHRLGHRLGRRYGQGLAVPTRILLVPAPSGLRRRWSGKEVVEPFTRAVAGGITEAGHKVDVVVLLKRRGGNLHHLSSRQRHVERSRAIRLNARRHRRMGEERRGGVIVLVDDVLTTGATLAAAASAAQIAAPVIGAIVLALTPKPMQEDPLLGEEYG